MSEMHIIGQHDDNTIEQLKEVAEYAEAVALMADGHLGYSMPIGGVAAFDNKVSVTGVGFDIACGNCAVKLDRKASDFPAAQFRELGYEIQNSIAFGVGRENRHAARPDSHELFNSGIWDIVPDGKPGAYKPWHRTPLREKARVQLGSIGSGNHYVDIFEDEDGAMWVGAHFGSRGFGHTIASNFIAIAGGGTWGDRGKEGMCLLDLDTDAGADYWALMNLAGEYAYAGRDWVCDTVASMIGGNVVDRVHNNHNFAWKEQHFGRELIIVRKGATPAFAHQRGFIGGSMGDDAVIVEGNRPGAHAGEPQHAAMFSTVHGAGRVMSRTAATGKNRRGKVRGEPRVKIDEVHDWLAKRNVLVFGADLDEAPQAYRRLADVLEFQGDTVEVEHTLRPLVVVMAGNDLGRSGKPANPFLSKPGGAR